MTDRIFALILLGFCAAAGRVAWGIHAPFAYEPVGPRAFPLLLLFLLALCAVLLPLRRRTAPIWPDNLALWLKITACFSLLFAYGYVFESLGFVLSTAIMITLLARLIGATWKQGALFGIAGGIGFYYFFDKLLDIVLPVGRIFRHWSF